MPTPQLLTDVISLLSVDPASAVDLQQQVQLLFFVWRSCRMQQELFAGQPLRLPAQA